MCFFVSESVRKRTLLQNRTISFKIMQLWHVELVIISRFTLHIFSSFGMSNVYKASVKWNWNELPSEILKVDSTLVHFAMLWKNALHLHAVN